MPPNVIAAKRKACAITGGSTALSARKRSALKEITKSLNCDSTTRHSLSVIKTSRDDISSSIKLAGSETQHEGELDPAQRIETV